MEPVVVFDRRCRCFPRIAFSGFSCSRVSHTTLLTCTCVPCTRTDVFHSFARCWTLVAAARERRGDEAATAPEP